MTPLNFVSESHMNPSILNPTARTSRTSRWNPWPWAIVGWFVCFFGVVISLTVTAVRSRSDVVAADYYNQELRFQQRIDAASRSEALANPPKVSFDPRSGLLQIQLPIAPKSGEAIGTVMLYRPDDARLDREFPLTPNSTGFLSIPMTGVKTGRWRVRLAWTSEGREFFHEVPVRVTHGV